MGDTSMSSFIRVRAVSGPKHEFYAGAEEVAVNAELYDVLDPEPVAVPGEVVYVVEKPAPQESKFVGDKKKEER